MNGAEIMMRTLLENGVDTVFTNPGTSEMQFVSALDRVEGMRAALCLFEGVATGAADGYARIMDRPAATLLHLGPGLGNGIANLHNARRAHSPIVNVVGEHASYHIALDPPLRSDIDALASNVSQFVTTATHAGEVSDRTAAAITHASRPPRGISTLIVTADASWNEGGDAIAQAAPYPQQSPDATLIRCIAEAVQGGRKVLLFLGGDALTSAGLLLASRIAAKTGIRSIAETFPARLSRGAGIPPVERLAYFSEFATPQLGEVDLLVLIGAQEPVSFFAYPHQPSTIAPEGTEILDLTEGMAVSGRAALDALCEELDASNASPTLSPHHLPELAEGPLTSDAVARIVGRYMPEGAIVVDEGITSGLWAPQHSVGSAPHDWLALSGGAIGFGLPCSFGASYAAPERRVIDLQADGSAMYTIQALWSQARHSSNVTTIIFNNSAYSILRLELSKVGAQMGPIAQSLMDLSNPSLNFCELASAMGVPATRVTTCEGAEKAIRASLATEGPHLIEAMVPPLV